MSFEGSDLYSVLSRLLNLKGNKNTMSVISFNDFCRDFAEADTCLQLLCDYKWAEGFCCKKCAHTHSRTGRKWFYRKCSKCDYDESCTAHTLFHKLKFPIQTAFKIIYLVSTFKKGISSCEISRQFKIHQQTAWFFRRKIQQSMQEEASASLLKWFSGDQHKTPGLTVGLELQYTRKSGKSCINRSYARILEPPLILNRKRSITKLQLQTPKSLIEFKTTAGKVSLGSSYHLQNLANWVKGIHHLISLEHFQRYLDEFNFRYNRKEEPQMNVFLEVTHRMIVAPWLSYRRAIAQKSN